jgi:uncharacterized protein
MERGMKSTTPRILIAMSSGGLPLQAPLPVLSKPRNSIARPAGLDRPEVAAKISGVTRNFTRSVPGAVRSVALTGPAGRLEAVLNAGAPGARYAALICHPHPSGGGNLHNKVVYHAMKAFNLPKCGFGIPVLRFNFRGMGLSEGTHDGKAEADDVIAALDWLDREFRLPIILAGFSFGAAMSLRACIQRARPEHDIRALIALGLPLVSDFASYQYPYLKNLSTPKLFLSGDHDQFAPAEQLAQVLASAAAPKRLILISGADHFFTKKLEPMQYALVGWLKEQLS